MNRFEIFISEAVTLVIMRTWIPALLLTTILSLLAGAYLRAVGRKRYDCSSLKWIFHEWIRISLILGIMSAVLYGTIFGYSVHVRKGMPAREAFEEALTDRKMRKEMPLSCPANLIGVKKNEVEGILGSSERKGFMDQYDGISTGGERYIVKVFYMPFAHRVLYCETKVEMS